MPLHIKNMPLVSDLHARWYFYPIEQAFQDKVIRFGLPNALNHLTDAMRAAQQPIEAMLDERVLVGKIRDKRQARVSVAGNGFQGLVALALAECQRSDLLDERLIFALKKKSHPLIERHAAITVANEIQKPDFDLLVYCDENDTAPLNIFSIKTSLRERGGQTYRWKLLLDVATAANSVSLKEKYGLSYEQGRPVSVSLIIADFYDEVKNPQQRGAFKFFNSVYVTKPVEGDELVNPLSKIVAALNEGYC